MQLMLAPLVLCSSSVFAQSSSESKVKPATNEDIYLYRGISASYVCNARASGIRFPKAVGIAAQTYAQLINGRHGGKVESVGKNRLTNKQIFTGAEFQIVTGALQFCPKEVPRKVKRKVQDAIDKTRKP